MKIQNALVSNILDRSQRYFAHVTTVTLSWRVQNIVVIGRVNFTLECFEFSSNFEFDRNMLSGTGARFHPQARAPQKCDSDSLTKQTSGWESYFILMHQLQNTKWKKKVKKKEKKKTQFRALYHYVLSKMSFQNKHCHVEWGTLLLTWFSLNPSIVKSSHAQ